MGISKDIKTLKKFQDDDETRGLYLFAVSGIAAWFGGRTIARRSRTSWPRIHRCISTSVLFMGLTLVVILRVHLLTTLAWIRRERHLH